MLFIFAFLCRRYWVEKSLNTFGFKNIKLSMLEVWIDSEIQIYNNNNNQMKYRSWRMWLGCICPTRTHISYFYVWFGQPNKLAKKNKCINLTFTSFSTYEKYSCAYCCSNALKPICFWTATCMWKIIKIINISRSVFDRRVWYISPTRPLEILYWINSRASCPIIYLIHPKRPEWFLFLSINIIFY